MWARQNFRCTVLNHHGVAERHGKVCVSINQYRVIVEPRGSHIGYGSRGGSNRGGHGAARSEEWRTGHVETLQGGFAASGYGQTDPVWTLRNQSRDHPPFGILGNCEGHKAELELSQNVYRLVPEIML